MGRDFNSAEKRSYEWAGRHCIFGKAFWRQTSIKGTALKKHGMGRNTHIWMDGRGLGNG